MLGIEMVVREPVIIGVNGDNDKMENIFNF